MGPKTATQRRIVSWETSITAFGEQLFNIPETAGFDRGLITLVYGRQGPPAMAEVTNPRRIGNSMQSVLKLLGIIEPKLLVFCFHRTIPKRS